MYKYITNLYIFFFFKKKKKKKYLYIYMFGLQKIKKLSIYNY